MWIAAAVASARTLRSWRISKSIDLPAWRPLPTHNGTAISSNHSTFGAAWVVGSKGTWPKGGPIFRICAAA